MVIRRSKVVKEEGGISEAKGKGKIRAGRRKGKTAGKEEEGKGHSECKES